MPYLVVDNFSAGLDSRRHVLSSKDGTLAVLKNAHITRGGEIEKRKAFTQFASLPQGTFGMETTADKVYVFGSVAPPTMPSGITYQRLQHPDGLAMTKVVWSTVYGGLPFVIAEYSDQKRFCFWDGAIIRDWFAGIATTQMGSLVNLAEHLRADFSFEGYTCTRSGTVLTITGPSGREFTVTATSTSPVTSTVAKIQSKNDGLPEVLSSGSFMISSGSEEPSKAQVGLRYIDVQALPNITGIYVNGVEITGITGAGIRWDDFNNGSVDGGQRLAFTLASHINNNSSNSGYTAEYAGYQYSGPDQGVVTIKADAALGTIPNGWALQFEFAADPSAVNNRGELVSGAITASPYNAGRFIGTSPIGPAGWPAGFSGGEYNRITSVKVDGVEIMGTSVPWKSSNSSTMVAIVEAINNHTSNPEYVAEFSNNKVVLTAMPGSGKYPNNRVISCVTQGNVVASATVAFAGGVNAIAALPQMNTVTIGGSFSAGAKVTITITDPNVADPYVFGASRVAGLKPNFSVTYKSKEYSAVGSTMYFSGLNDATKWDVYDIGSGFIDMSNNFGGREDLTGFGVYQDKLAVFSRRNVQLWFLDADPAQNQQLQILANTGCVAPDSIVSMGAIDLLYLADNGIRSLRARESTDTAFASDIGSAVDSVVLSHMATLTDDQKYASKAVVEPLDGRYWLAVGNKIFVLSYFPGSNIAAWSTYEPGFTVDEFAAQGSKVYARSGNIIYLYGGADGNTYDASQVVVEFPYMDARKPATYKRAKAIDLTIEGLWRAEMGFDHTNPSAREVILRSSDSTFAYGTVPVAGIGTHFGLRMVNETAGAAKITNVILHYDELQPKHEAG